MKVSKRKRSCGKSHITKGLFKWMWVELFVKNHIFVVTNTQSCLKNKSKNKVSEKSMPSITNLKVYLRGVLKFTKFSTKLFEVFPVF